MYIEQKVKYIIKRQMSHFWPYIVKKVSRNKAMFEHLPCVSHWG